MSKRSVLSSLILLSVSFQFTSAVAAPKSTLMLEANSAETQGNPRKASELYNKIVAAELKNPDSTEAARAQLRLANIHINVGELTAAEPGFKVAIGLKPEMLKRETELMVDMDDMAEAYFAQSKKNVAVKECLTHALALRQKIDAKHPNVAVTYRHLALHMLDRGDWRAAEAYLKQGMVLQKNCSPSKLGRLISDRALLTSIYITHDEWAKAEQLTRESLVQSQNVETVTWAWPLLHYTLGRCHSQKEEYDDAGREYETAIALAKKFPNPQCDISPEVHKAIQNNLLLKQKKKMRGRGR